MAQAVGHEAGPDDQQGDGAGREEQHPGSGVEEGAGLVHLPAPVGGRGLARPGPGSPARPPGRWSRRSGSTPPRAAGAWRWAASPGRACSSGSRLAAGPPPRTPGCADRAPCSGRCGRTWGCRATVMTRIRLRFDGPTVASSTMASRRAGKARSTSSTPHDGFVPQPADIAGQQPQRRPDDAPPAASRRRPGRRPPALPPTPG